MKKVYFLFFPMLLLFFSNFKWKQTMSVDENSSLATVLEQLGDTTLLNRANTSIAGVSAAQGEALVLTGFAQTKDGAKTSKQSAHFVCTSCHNIQRDEPDLSKTNPQARLDYVEKMGLPFYKVLRFMVQSIAPVFITAIITKSMATS
ncbi:MAG: hypothetical protein HC892_02300 [Saprospiraceae bacterium]|nr:hypothetical protein [Saprospiraceae bacterium]